MTEKKAEKKGVKKGDVVIKAKKMIEFTDKQGIKRKGMKEFDVSANGFSSVLWYGVEITDGEKYYIDKAIDLGAEKAKK